MKMKVQIIIEYEGGQEPITHELACITRGDLLPESLGLTLAEGKDLLARMQEDMVYHQVALQLRTKTMNNDLRDMFQQWYPGMAKVDEKTNSKSSFICQN